MEVELFVTDDGRRPYAEWYDSLRDTMSKRRINNRLTQVREGNLGDINSVGGGVMEMRLHFGPGYRIYFGRADTTIVLLLCAGDKDTQDSDISIARQHWARYEERRYGQGQ